MSAVPQSYEVKAGLAEIEGFTVTGLSLVTDNTRATNDINELWERFFCRECGSENL
ncbi:MAG: hypothetical protein LRY54_01415 [Alphaproteobacteria bacterium]|nr:hypothetical protein [Alphaproteobacteria bacterium]